MRINEKKLVHEILAEVLPEEQEELISPLHDKPKLVTE
jgi:hypothetical protein